MAPTSELLKMHIGTVERWIDQMLKKDDNYHYLENHDCILTDGVKLKSRDGNVTLSPTSAEYDLTAVDPDWFGDICSRYAELIHSYDASMIAYAADLDARRLDYEEALIKERVYGGEPVWWRNTNGVWQIEVDAITKGRAHYRVLNGNPDERGEGHLNHMRFFLTQEEAINPTKEGYRVK